MLLRLAALGALGYAGYKYYQKNGDSLRQAFNDGVDRVTGVGQAPAGDNDPVELAGGPLSADAQLVHRGDALPA